MFEREVIMPKFIKELTRWLIEETYYNNFKKAKGIIRVINRNGYSIDYEELIRANNYELKDFINYFNHNVSNILTRRVL